jgi:hypothetical protein
MFLAEALLRCSQFQKETASHYDAFCIESPADGARIEAWKGASRRERRRASFLEALAFLCSALEDEGPFLVQIRLQLEEVRRALDHARWRRDNCTEHPRCGCAEMIESIPLARLYADLIELAEPEVRRGLRLIANELRAIRRDSDGRAPRREGKMAMAGSA